MTAQTRVDAPETDTTAPDTEPKWTLSISLRGRETVDFSLTESRALGALRALQDRDDDRDLEGWFFLPGLVVNLSDVQMISAAPSPSDTASRARLTWI
ncbi:hypothetical protein DSD19_17695 [Rhodovulum sp. BSW8]|uniref:Tail assembly chaperone E/41/14-like protein n=1 Tax=Rhodovulum visakhapatnamense TaxID=364297 RepID=A0ABS1RLS2_9RHOB|nr:MULTISPECIES: hypothetical protein [Rhodovulum]MBL3571646.1 hypothetical protein [Rhodovulum visakhapatnamense]MBL3580631.1 hypothetical protein [Rhodovulum visakhapatnamense]OLS44683.1 hypothetical protein BV509_10260 [Rhodovulum sulfidophilum]RBO51929.1 hypothetical protein DSD19_17695 [Rhodovulum sp. BSW8]